MMKIMKCLLVLLIYSKSFASFEVAPPVQFINLNRARATDAMIINNSDKLVRIKIYAQRPENQPADYYIGENLIIYPKLLYLKPRSRRPVRFGLRVNKELDDGEYRTQIVYEELSNEVIGKEEELEETGVQLEILSKVIGTLYADKGEIVYSVNSEGFKFEKNNGDLFLTGSIKNTGIGSIRPLLKITYYDDKDKALLTEKVFLSKLIRGNTNKIFEKLKKAPNKFKFTKIEILRMEEDFDTDGEEKLEEIKVQV